jgi:hypothetical protein
MLHPGTAGGCFDGTHAGCEATGAAPTRLPRGLVLHLIAQDQFPWLLTDESLPVHPLEYRATVVVIPSYKTGLKRQEALTLAGRFLLGTVPRDMPARLDTRRPR